MTLSSANLFYHCAEKASNDVTKNPIKRTSGKRIDASDYETAFAWEHALHTKRRESTLYTSKQSNHLGGTKH